MAIVGIDLGTTMSAIARLDEMGKPQVIPNSEGDLITPSVVLFEDKTNKVVGKVAKQSSVAYPDRVVEFVKNEMGKATKWEFFGEPYSPEDISAIILRRLKADAEQTLGEPVERAVITVPAIFGEAERNATKSAGRIAGLDVIALLDEPVAAALSYGFGRETGSDEAQNVLVYDLGGGTFDLTVMRIAGNKIKMLATDGDRRLGGRDWDDKIIEFVARQFEAEHGVDPKADLECFQDLRNRAENAKKTLTRLRQTRIICQYGGKTSRVELTREKFNELTADLLSQTETTCQVVVSSLQASGKLPGGWGDIHHVLLAGGSSRMLQVQEMLGRISGKTPEMLEVDLVVAQGAALYSVMKVIQEAEETGKTAELEKLGLPAGVEDLLARKEVTRVCSFALGIVALDEKRREQNAVLIERNTELPADKTRPLGTSEDNQTEILITVLEGEDRDPALCLKLGEGHITEIPSGLPKSSPVDITFRLTDESRVEVTAVEKTHGKRCQFELAREVGKSEVEIEEARRRLAMDKVA